MVGRLEEDPWSYTTLDSLASNFVIIGRAGSDLTLLLPPRPPTNTSSSTGGSGEIDVVIIAAAPLVLFVFDVPTPSTASARFIRRSESRGRKPGGSDRVSIMVSAVVATLLYPASVTTSDICCRGAIVRFIYGGMVNERRNLPHTRCRSNKKC